MDRCAHNEMADAAPNLTERAPSRVTHAPKFCKKKQRHICCHLLEIAGS